MSTAARSDRLRDGLAAVLRGEAVSYSALGTDPDTFFAVCGDEDLTGLVQRHVSDEAGERGWPDRIRDELARRSRDAIATELLRRQELRTVLEALARDAVRPVLLKGTALAYTVYDAPSLRPRCDTDLLLPAHAVDVARSAVIRLGYSAPAYCEQVFSQFQLVRQDAHGVAHVCDFHWNISTQATFADLLTYDEIAGEAAPVPALGPHARAAGLVHALLLACVHPVMHHRAHHRLIWSYDVHLLMSRLSSDDFDRFAELAVAKRVAAICAHALTLARSRFNTAVPERLWKRLTPHHEEPSAAYLAPNRSWRDELLSNVRGLPEWSNRLRFLREIAFPSPSYMLQSYGLANGILGTALLPALYLHRGVRGVWRVLSGRK